MPALTFSVSANFAFANLLASDSFANVSVALANERLPGIDFLGAKETYQVSLDLAAMNIA